MNPAADAGIALLFFVVAALYASVGHAGASGYLAVMTLVLHLEPNTARPTALILNLVVATIGTIQFQRAQLIPWRSLAFFALGSVPLAFLGGCMNISTHTYDIAVGVVLLAAGLRLLLGTIAARAICPPWRIVAVAVGAVIGLLSGVTGTGGGIFLTPVLLLLGWAPPKQAAGMSVAFILVNSAAGLAGRMTRAGIVLPADSFTWMIAAAVGGLLGSWYGARKSGLTALRRLLAVVLLIAAAKLLVGGI